MFSALYSPSHARETTVRLLPREEEFFDLFVAVATRNIEAAQHLQDLFAAPPDRRVAHVEAIKRLEHEADQVTHEIVNRLAIPTAERIWFIRYALKAGLSVDDVHRRTNIDPWFLHNLREILEMEDRLRA